MGCLHHLAKLGTCRVGEGDGLKGTGRVSSEWYSGVEHNSRKQLLRNLVAVAIHLNSLTELFEFVL